MPVTKGDFISLNYTGDSAGIVFDTTDEQRAEEEGIHSEKAAYGPFVIRVGGRHVIVGLDDDLEGKEVGYQGDLEVPPEKAFGQRDPDRVRSLPKSSFKEKPFKGMPVRDQEIGEGVVVDVVGGRVVVDFNHPLAGKTLHYAYTIEDIIEAPEKKLLGLIRLYAGRDLEVQMEDGVATINLPPGIVFDRRWMLWRSRIVSEAFDAIPDLREIVLKEVFLRPKDTPEE